MTSVKFLIFICAAVASWAWLLVWCKCSVRRRGWAVLALLWTAHVAVFTLATHYRVVAPLGLNLWSSIVRVHGLLSILILAIDLLTDSRCAGG